MKPRKPGQWWDESLTLQDGCRWPDGLEPEGCRNCWAKRMARRWRRDTEEIVLHPERSKKVSVRGAAKTYGVPINNGDLFQERVPAEFGWRMLDELRRINVDRRAAGRELHRFVFLTKRPRRCVKIAQGWQDERTRRGDDSSLEHSGFFFLVSAWDQRSVDEACAALFLLPDDLCWGPEGWRWGLHLEPLLRMVTVSGYRLGWIVVGGENGPGARPMHPDWARSLRDECAARSIPFFLKGLGQGQGRTLDGREHDETPWGAA